MKSDCRMTTPVKPTMAYDLLTDVERQAVDEYINYAVAEQHRKRERIIHALDRPIPNEYLVRSKDRLYKPLVLAAVAERIKEMSLAEDISPDRVIQEHAAIATSKLSDYLEPAGFGTFQLKPMEGITPAHWAAVKSLETKAGPFGLSAKIVLHDKHPSLKALGEMMGIVSPDQPPALREYIAPPQALKSDNLSAPVEIYQELLEKI